MAGASKTQEVEWKYHCKDGKYRIMPTNHIIWGLIIIPILTPPPVTGAPPEITRALTPQEIQ